MKDLIERAEKALRTNQPTIAMLYMVKATGAGK